MNSWFSYIYDEYDKIWQLRDPRVENWPMMSSPLPTLLVCLGYFMFVLVWGPKWMKDRPAYNLKSIIIAYNLFQTIFSIWMFYTVSKFGWFHNYSFVCQPVDYSMDPSALAIVSISWWYYISKFTEFLDTVFFVLRKKNDQISWLHVIHHGVVPFSVWFGVRFVPGGHATFFAFLNTFVHIFMYFYYMLAALGPAFRPYCWWKKYLTKLQMIQFVVFSVHEFQLLFIDCDFPKAFVWLIGMHGVVFFLLFSNFYNQSYVRVRNDMKASISRDISCQKTKLKYL